MASSLDDLDEVFRALADASRRTLLDRLNERNGQTLHDLCTGLGMARQSVSKHLAVLEAANLISTRRQGREKLHDLNPVPINAIAERWMGRYDRTRVRALANLKHVLERPTLDNSFVYTTFIRTTPEQLWTAITDPVFTRQYWGVALISDWQVGSAVIWELPSLTIADPEQEVLVAEPPRVLAYTWHRVSPEFLATYGAEADKEWIAHATAEPLSHVRWELEPQGDLVKLVVTHEHFAADSVILPGVAQGWPEIIASLKSLLETGTPLTTAVSSATVNT